MNELRHLDLFAGIGGFTLAFEWACAAAGRSGRTVAFAECDPAKSAWLRELYPGIPNLGRVESLTRGHLPGRIDVLTGGVPCQPASLAGRRGGTADPRWLWPAALDCVAVFQPALVLFENPPALLTLQAGVAFAGILGALDELRYHCWWDVFPAAALGAGHRRQRLFLVAADPHQTRLEGYARHGEVRRDAPATRHPAPPHLCARTITGPLWYHQSGLQPVVDGLPGALVRRALEGAGDAVVPHVPALILTHALHILLP